jgi:hypothetical protein
MISLKKLVFASVLVAGSITSSQAAAAKTMCDTSRDGVPFQIALIKPVETEVTCVYSAEVMYEIQGRFNPILEQGAKWERNNHTGYYCRSPSNNPRACRFTRF